MLEPTEVKRILEAALLAAHEPVPVARLEKLFAAGELPAENPRNLLRDTLAELSDDLADRGIELVRVGSGYRFQVRQSMSPWVSRLWDEKPPRYSRAAWALSESWCSGGEFARHSHAARGKSGITSARVPSPTGTSHFCAT